MKTFSFLIIALLLTGCAAVQIETVSKTGETCRAQYTTLFKTLEGVKMSACHAKGEAASSDVQLSEALIGALIKGMAK